MVLTHYEIRILGFDSLEPNYTTIRPQNVSKKVRQFLSFRRVYEECDPVKYGSHNCKYNTVKSPKQVGIHECGWYAMKNLEMVKNNLPESHKVIFFLWFKITGLCR